MNSFTRYFLIFSISLLTLLLEFLQIRIFSFQYWYHLVYFIITMALLGIAIGGTITSLSAKLKMIDENKFYALCFFGFAVSTSLGTFLVSFLSGDFFSFWQNKASILFLMIAYILAMVPYIFFGLAMARAWIDTPQKAAKIYFFNLAGSAFGIISFIVLLQPLGAEHLIQGLVIISLLIGLSLYPRPAFDFKRTAKFFISMLFAISLITAFSLLIKPDKNKLYWTFGESIFSEWNPVARIDVMKDSEGKLTILNDGDAQTPLGFFTSYHRVLIYAARGYNRPLGSVLVIGSGGGADVRLAYNFGSRDIDAVEINPSTNRLVKQEFAYVHDNIFGQEGVHLFEQEGRSFIEKSAKKYDVIMLMGVDNLAASNPSAYVMTENYPYTLEAFEDYWDHLSDNGFVQISRFYYPRTPRETFRVFTTFFEALRKKGIEDPEKHMIVVVNTENVLTPFGTVLVSKKPINDAVVANIDDWFKKEGSELSLGFLFPKLSEGVGKSGHDVFSSFVDSWKENKAASFYKDYFFDVEPATDDKPFFFQHWKLANMFKSADISIYEEYYNNIRKQPFLVLFYLLVQSSAIVFCLLFFPLRKLKTKIKRPNDWFYPLMYFSAIGFGFMFLEMALIQKIILYVGHPIYSLAVVIPALFFGLATGSLFSSKINFKQQYVMIIFLVLIILILVFAFSRDYLNFLLYQNLKIALTLTFIGTASLGFFAGIPFPSGMVRLSKIRHFIPLAWAANGSFSVIGSILAVILAMLFGFNVVMILSSMFYLAAFILITVWDRNAINNI